MEKKLLKMTGGGQRNGSLEPELNHFLILVFRGSLKRQLSFKIDRRFCIPLMKWGNGSNECSNAPRVENEANEWWLMRADCAGVLLWVAGKLQREASTQKARLSHKWEHGVLSAPTLGWDLATHRGDLALQPLHCDCSKNWVCCYLLFLLFYITTHKLCIAWRACFMLWM